MRPPHSNDDDPPADDSNIGHKKEPQLQYGTAISHEPNEDYHRGSRDTLWEDSGEKIHVPKSLSTAAVLQIHNTPQVTRDEDAKLDEVEVWLQGCLKHAVNFYGIIKPSFNLSLLHSSRNNSCS